MKHHRWLMAGLGLALVAACGGTKPAEQPSAPASADHAGMEAHTEKAGGHEGHQQTGHGHEGDHMRRMEEVKAWLQKELGDKYSASVPPATSEQLERGKQVFMKNCSTCHGETGKGDGPAGAALDPKPADFTDPHHAAFYSDAGRLHIIHKGSPATAMVAWEKILSEDEITSVHGYVRSLREKGASK